MKELLLKYAQFNAWANQQFIELMLSMPPELIEKEVVSSFPSIKATSIHIWSAEYMWLQRLMLTENPVWVQSTYTGSFENACKEWKDTSGKLVAFVEKQFDDRSFTHVLQYYDLKKNSHKTPVYLVLQHVFNHSTNHRGQLITLLRQADVKKIPSTDFIQFARNLSR